MNSSRRNSRTELLKDMEPVSAYLKENFDLVMLLVGVLGVVISVIAVAVEIKKNKNTKSNKRK